MITTSPSLLERLRSPNQAAWEKFVDLYTPLLFSWTRRLGLDAADAADFLQELFLTLVETLPRFEYEADKSFRAWLKTILYNRWRNFVRKRANLKIVTGQDALSGLAEREQPPDLEETEYRQHLVARALELMQAEFEASTWKACWEYVVRDRPAADVAREFGLTVNAVYLAKSRVLRRLREELTGLLE